MPVAKSPIVGGWNVARSPDAADNELYNLQVNFIETKDGVVPAWLGLTAGLDLLVSVDDGPVRAARALGTTLYVLSGITVYSVAPDLTVTALGNITSAGVIPVSMFDNGFQLMIVDGYNAWLVPGGYPLSGGSVNSGGAGYTVGDTITLKADSGAQYSYPIITVATVAAGAVATFTVSQGGAQQVQAANFSQLRTSGGGSGFTLNSPTYGTFLNLVPVTVPFANPLAGDVSDGFGLLVFENSQNIAQSNQGDLSTWSALAFGVANQSPDMCVSIKVVHDQAYVLKERNTEVWADAGTSPFAFQSLQGVHMEYGCAATFSVAKAEEELLWLSRNDEGQGVVVQARGYSISTISTQAMASEFQTYPTLSDAIGYAYQQEGHTYYVLTFPSADKTWCCDLTTSKLVGQPVWHRRAAFSNGQWHRHLGNVFTTWNNGKGGQVLGVLGDYSSGNLYQYNPATLTDNGTARRWLRTWRAKARGGSSADRFSYLWVYMQTGAGMGPSDNPQVVLRWSDDGGHTWSDQRIGSVGRLGATDQAVKFNRLGSTRRFGATNRIFELSSTDAFKVAILDAEVQTS